MRVIDESNPDGQGRLENCWSGLGAGMIADGASKTKIGEREKN